jgi:hypothetical protein
MGYPRVLTQDARATVRPVPPTCAIIRVTGVPKADSICPRVMRYLIIPTEAPMTDYPDDDAEFVNPLVPPDPDRAAWERQVGAWWDSVHARSVGYDQRWSTVGAFEREFICAVVRLAAEQAARAWRPIDTAPKDERPVDLWASGRRWTDCTWTGAYWFSPHGIYDSGAEMEVHGHVPTHWMPLPPPPEGA